MARWIGGEIDHILLWPLGGICFSSRPSSVYDPRAILSNELKVVAAGPATHFVMTPLWVLIFVSFCKIVQPVNSDTFACEGLECAWSLFDGTPPINGSISPWMVECSLLVWELCRMAVHMNIGLFLFNVFFPMYPADGSKLLVVSLMYCCRVTAHRAATVLIGCSVVCGSLCLLYMMHIFHVGAEKGGNLRTVSAGLLGMMGCMSLVEAYRIYNLRESRQLHTHSLFEIARSWSRTRHDGRGNFTQLNTSANDDDLGTVPPGSCQCFPCWSNTDGSSADHELEWTAQPSGEQRAQRGRFLDDLERRQRGR